MGAVMICRDEPVKTPYYIESMGIRLYSMEELAFFLYENVYLADRQMLGKRLWEWLRTEAHNPDLAEKLKKGAEAGSSIQNMVLTILRSVDYYTQEELTELSSRMKVLNTYQEQERLKLRADEYFINGNYLASIYEYEKILDIRQSDRLGVEFYAHVWNNLGVCFAKQFLFERAKDCFEHALEYTPDEEIRKQAELAEKLMYGPAPLSGTIKNEDQLQRQLLSWEQEYRTRRRQ